MRPAARLARIASPTRLPPPRRAAASRTVPAGRRPPAAAGVQRPASATRPKPRLRIARRPAPRPWRFVLGVVATLAVVVLVGLGLGDLVAQAPPVLVAAGMPRSLAVPVAVAPVWGAVFAGVRVAMAQAPDPAADTWHSTPPRDARRSGPAGGITA